MTKALRDIHEGGAEEAPDATVTGLAEKGGAAEAPDPTVAGLAEKAPRGAVLSQHDDWMHRGDDPIVRDMSLYIYSVWVYRVEPKAHARSAGDLAEAGRPASAHIDIPFDPSYAAARNWTQRLATEPRIPKVEGFQFVSAGSNAETHYLMKSVLLRPVFLPCADEDIHTKELRYLEAYKRLCSAPQGQDRWPAQPSGEASPGPFQRGWQRFLEEQEIAAERARKRCLQNDIGPWSTPSIWSTAEVEAELLQKRLDRGNGGGPPCACRHCVERGDGLASLLTMQEYMALETTKTAANFDGISMARCSKSIPVSSIAISARRRRG